MPRGGIAVLLRRYLRALGLLALLTPLAHAQSNPLDAIELTRVATGLSSPVSIKAAGDGSGRLFLVERRGTIRIWENGSLRADPLLSIVDRVRAGGEQGLLDVAFHPQFAQNGFLFVNYTRSNDATVVSRFSMSADRNRADAASETVFLSFPQPFRNHNGGQLQFGPDGYLYVSTGDGGSGGDPGNRAQSLSTLLGKMLRIDVDRGTESIIPPTNPFVSPLASQSFARGEIWAYGLRNPWRFSFDRATGDVWIGDVGQSAVEEVDFQPADSTGGENYGWRLMEGSTCFNPSSTCNDGTLTLPVLEYRQLREDCGGSVTGGYRYRGAMHPQLQGLYLFADFCTQSLYAGREQAGGGWELLGPRVVGLGISSFGEGEDGELYLADLNGGAFYSIGAAAVPPRISSGGVVNGASFSAGRGIAPGSIASIFGQGLSTGAQAASATPLPTTLASSSVRFDGSAAAPQFFASPGQINLQVPWELEGLDEARLRVTVAGLPVSPVETVALTRVSPGVFTMDQSGAGQAAALIAGSNGALAAPTGSFAGARPARLGESLEIFATGLGPVSDRPATGAHATAISPTLEQPTVRVGVEPVRVLFSGLAPGFVGLYQVNVELIGDLPSGQAVPLALSIAGTDANPVTIAIE